MREKFLPFFCTVTKNFNCLAVWIAREFPHCYVVINYYTCAQTRVVMHALDVSKEVS